MAPNHWYKFYGGEYLSDPKIAALSAQERSCWVTLLSLASISSTPGTVEYLTVEVLLQKSGIIFDPYHPEEWNAALSVLDKFSRMKMITKKEDGTLVINNWEKRQETALTNAERQARFRERNGKVTKPVTKVTLDKIREEENKDTFASQKILPPSEVREVRVTTEGEDKPPKEVGRRDAAAWATMQKSVKLMQEQMGVEVVTGVKEYQGILRALKHLKEEQILEMVQDAIDDGSAEKKGLSLAAILSNLEINKYRLRS